MEILETLTVPKVPGQLHIDPSYMERVYTILGKQYEGAAKLDGAESKLFEQFEIETKDVAATVDIGVNRDFIFVRAGEKPSPTTLRVMFFYVKQINYLKFPKNCEDKIVTALQKVIKAYQ